MSQTKKRGVLAPLVIVGVTAGFLYAAYRFVFAKKKKVASLQGALDLAPVSTAKPEETEQQAATAAAHVEVATNQSSSPKTEENAAQEPEVATEANNIAHTEHHQQDTHSATKV